jgi:prophage regulatory protein
LFRDVSFYSFLSQANSKWDKLESYMASKCFRPKQAAEFLGIGVATFWRWAKERHDFPKMIRLSARCTVVDGDQLIAWRDAQATKVA